MKKSIAVSISEPCHEDWSAMTPTQKGKFCASCTKEVIDFTSKTDEAIVEHVLRNENLCGRFIPSQLDRQLTLERKSGYRFAPLAASLLLPFTLFATTDKKPTIKPQQKEFTSIGVGSLNRGISLVQKKLNASDTTKVVTISGTITDTSGLPLPGVNVVIKGTNIGTQTDFDGNYNIEVEHRQTIVFTYVGFKTREILVSNISNEISIELHEDIDLMGDIVIVGLMNVTSKFVDGPSVKPFGKPIDENLYTSDFEISETKKAQLNHKKFMELKRAKAKAAKRLKRNRKNNKD